MHALKSSRGERLYRACALAGAVLLFTGPVLVLLFSQPSFLAACLGYAGITLFTGGVAATFDFATHRRPTLQLLKNLAIATAVTGLFFGLYLIL